MRFRSVMLKTAAAAAAQLHIFLLASHVCRADAAPAGSWHRPELGWAIASLRLRQQGRAIASLRPCTLASRKSLQVIARRPLASLQPNGFEGADMHWDNFIAHTESADYHSQFCKWAFQEDLESRDLVSDVHILRSLRVEEDNAEPFLRHTNTYFFEDHRGTVMRGPWNMTREDSTELGIVHPAAGIGRSFLVMAGSARATAWMEHCPVLDNRNSSAEMIMKHPLKQGVRFSVSFQYSNITGELTYVALFREDVQWPSPYWTQGSGTEIDVVSQGLSDSLDDLGLSDSLDDRCGDGGQIEIPLGHQHRKLSYTPLADVGWAGHLVSLQSDKSLLFKFPDGISK
jgi:hypothetical protein